MESIKPIFITGVYRTGTTLISRILNNHSDLSITYDSVHFMRFSFNKYNPVHKPSNFSSLVNEIQTRLEKRWNINLDSKKIINKLEKSSHINYAEVYHTIMSNLLLDNTTAKRWGEKTNMCWGKIPDFLKMFPKGKTILVVRDPRDVLISYKNMTTEPGLRYLDAVFALLGSFQSVDKFLHELSKDNFYLLKYEDLIRDAESVIQNLSKFLEIDFTPSMLDSKQFKDKIGNKWEGNSSFDKSIRGISHDAIGRWKSRISKVELYFVEMVLREQMLKLDYDLAASPLNTEEWKKLFNILNDDFIKQRYARWLKSGKGHESYPSDPIKKAYREIQFKE